MRIKSFNIFCITSWLFFSFCKSAASQNNAPDTLVASINQAIVDTSYNANEEDVQEYEDSVKRAKVNAFDTLGSHYQQPIYLRNLDAHYVQRFLKDDAFSYVENGIPKPKQKQLSGRRGFDIRYIWITIAVGAFIAFLLWYLNQQDIFLFRRKSTALSENKWDEDDKDIFSINFNEAIDKARKDKKYRQAIRLQYLQVIKYLTEKSIIHYQPDKTNLEYLLQLKASNYYKPFFDITRNYEYSWYGLFDVDESTYNYINKDFATFYDQVK